MAKKHKKGNFWKKFVGWIVIIAMIGSVFAMAFEVLFS